MESNITSQIDIKSLVTDLLHNLIFIIIGTAGIGILTYIWVSYSYQPVYSAKATITVSNKSANTSIINNLSNAKELAGRLSQVLESSLMRKAVMEDLGLSEYKAQTSAVQVPETNMIEITVKSGNPYETYRIMDSVMRNYTTVSDWLVGDYALEVLSPPGIPMRPSNPLNVKDPVKKAVLLAAAVFTLLTLLLSFARDTVKNEQQLSRKIDCHRLGVIYHEDKTDRIYKTNLGRRLSLLLRSKKDREKDKSISMLITNPMRSFYFVESNKLAASRVRSRMDRKGASVLMVTSVMENEGKSTVAANLALGIAAEGAKVLLIDGDFRKPSQFKIFGLDENMRCNLRAIMSDGARVDRLAKQIPDSNLWIIANSKYIRISDKEFKNERIRAILDYYREQMDYIIMDSSPMALVNDAEELTDLTDATLLVIHEDMVPAAYINDAIDTLNHSHSHVLGCIFSDASRNRMSSSYGYGYNSKQYGGYDGNTKQ